MSYRRGQYAAIDALIDRVQHQFASQPQLSTLFTECFLNTLATTVELLDDGTAFVLTGDIPAMWLRDSSAQIHPYIELAKEDQELQRLLRGLIERQARFMLIDPYANAFNKVPGGYGHSNDLPVSSPWVWERKFELDSLCYPLKLCYDYWRATSDTTCFTETVYRAWQEILHVMRVEQRHDQESPYSFIRSDAPVPSDTLPLDGKGTRTKYTGMVWSGFRPSDDACRFGYLLPANMFAVVVLGFLAEMASQVYQDETLAREALALQREIERGIRTYGTVEHPHYGRIYAYETDGYGNHYLMDDANVPSLLAIPYLGYRPAADPVYQNTRRFLLSTENPTYATGTYARGIGSPHTPQGYVWPIALAMQGLTSTDSDERKQLVQMLLSTTADTGYMHESFDPNDPAQFTRPWFAWANSLCAELLLSLLTE